MDKIIRDLDKIITETLWHLDAAAEEFGWDQPPELYTVLTTGVVTDGIGVIELKAAPGWGICVEKTGNPREALEVMKWGLAKAPPFVRATLPREELQGLALITEAWMVRAPLDEALDDEMMREGQASKHPDRFEVRMIFCVLADGTVAALNHERDGIVDVVTDRAAIQVGGLIPELLASLLKEMKS